MIDAFYIRKDHVKVEKENQTGSVNLCWTISRKKYIFLFYFLTIYPRLIYMEVLFFCVRARVSDRRYRYRLEIGKILRNGTDRK